ncbi:hypothetical protein LS684_04490 [Cytobacillus spongiae]|uniref:hypothetical protein n=1 Tax=Cytobacillus spongiae TaxID=2901381 RepID=UPI001F4177D2|nr:hypothetical protein [Cytobacillus spongiae]UII56730.1 hypothetical protein LS684_04490 [Cytobacillus spongiae]
MKKDKLDKQSVPPNSSMAENLAEIEILGKQMENLRTNQELKEDDKHPDPIQDEKNSTRKTT